MRLRKCLTCGTYTMKDKCSKGHETVAPRPAKYSPEDAYGSYRREAKKESLEKRGLI